MATTLIEIAETILASPTGWAVVVLALAAAVGGRLPMRWWWAMAGVALVATVTLADWHDRVRPPRARGAGDWLFLIGCLTITIGACVAVTLLFRADRRPLRLMPPAIVFATGMVASVAYVAATIVAVCAAGLGCP